MKEQAARPENCLLFTLPNHPAGRAAALERGDPAAKGGRRVCSESSNHYVYSTGGFE